MSNINKLKLTANGKKVNENGAIILRRLDKTYPEDNQKNSKEDFKQLYYSSLDNIVQENYKDYKKNELLELEKKPKSVKIQKKSKKAKKIVKNLQLELSKTTLDKPTQISSIFSAIISLSERPFVHNDSLYTYDDNRGIYNQLSKHEAYTYIRSVLDSIPQENLTHKFTVRDIKDTYQQLLWNSGLQIHELEIFNRPYVNCKNGVLSIANMNLEPHSPNHIFTYCCNANYDKNSSGMVFDSFINTLTNNDKSLKNLIQEVMGYCLSDYVNAKKAFLFYGVSNSGKSVLLNLLSYIVDTNNVCSVDLQHMSNPTYVAQLADKKLNIAPDLPSKPIKDIGIFKSLVSNLDSIESRNLYKDPKRQQCNCKLVFASNQPIKLVDIDSYNAEAFFNRLIILPCLNSIPEKEQDSFLIDKLKQERDYIFTWSMHGLKRLVKNNFQFTNCKISEKVKKQHMQSYCPELIFCKRYLDFSDTKSKVLTSEINNLFSNFCGEISVKCNKDKLKNFLFDKYQVSKDRKRINKGKNPQYVYLGVSIK